MKRKIVYRIAELGGYYYPQQKLNQELFNKWECMFRSIPEFYLPSGDNVLPVIKFKTEKEAMDFIIILKETCKNAQTEIDKLHTENVCLQELIQEFYEWSRRSGQIAAQPNNRIVWADDSFVKSSSIPQYKVMPPITWHAEIGRNAQDTAFTQD
jgi:hypothetical protein